MVFIQKLKELEARIVGRKKKLATDYVKAQRETFNMFH